MLYVFLFGVLFHLNNFVFCTITELINHQLLSYKNTPLSTLCSTSPHVSSFCRSQHYLQQWTRNNSFRHTQSKQHYFKSFTQTHPLIPPINWFSKANEQAHFQTISSMRQQQESPTHNVVNKNITISYPITYLNMYPIDIVLTDPDFKTLRQKFAQSSYFHNVHFKRIAATIFAPIDSSFESVLLHFNLTTSPVSNVYEYDAKILDFHLVSPRLVSPDMIPLDSLHPLNVSTRYHGFYLQLERLSQPSDLGAVTIRVNGYAKVVEIIKAKRGWIYKLDSILGPPWNPNIPINQFLKETPWLSKTKTMMDTLGLFKDRTQHLGPMTFFMIPDDGWKINGIDIPDCVFKAFSRPSNRQDVLTLLKWLTVPGLFNSTQIQHLDTIKNVEGRILNIGHIATQTNQIKSMIESRQVIQWDIPIYNGWLHLLSEMPITPLFNPIMALWDCVDELCYECPKLSSNLLHYFDQGGLLPSPRPFEYIVPLGPRPEWVCQGAGNWFPPGWSKVLWDRYISYMNKNSKIAARVLRLGGAKAANDLSILHFKLEDSRLKLKRIQAAPQFFDLHQLLDPSSIISFIISKTPFTEMSERIPQCKYNIDPENLSINDLRYLTRWM